MQREICRKEVHHVKEMKEIEEKREKIKAAIDAAGARDILILERVVAVICGEEEK